MFPFPNISQLSELHLAFKLEETNEFLCQQRDIPVAKALFGRRMCVGKPIKAVISTSP